MRAIRALMDTFRSRFTGKQSTSATSGSTAPESSPTAPEPAKPGELYVTTREASLARQYEQAARAAFRQGKYEEALESARQSLHLDPTNLMAYHYLGSAYLELGRWDEGIAAFERAQEQGDPWGLAESWIQEAHRRRRGEPPREDIPPAAVPSEEASERDEENGE